MPNKCQKKRSTWPNIPSSNICECCCIDGNTNSLDFPNPLHLVRAVFVVKRPWISTIHVCTNNIYIYTPSLYLKCTYIKRHYVIAQVDMIYLLMQRFTGHLLLRPGVVQGASSVIIQGILSPSNLPWHFSGKMYDFHWLSIEFTMFPAFVRHGKWLATTRNPQDIKTCSDQQVAPAEKYMLNLHCRGPAFKSRL